MIAPQRAAVAVFVVFASACLALVYLSAAGHLPPLLAVGLALAAPLAALVGLAWRTRWRKVALIAATGLVVAAIANSGDLASTVSTLWFVQHLAVHLLLAGYFGSSLLPRREPIATRIARAVLPALSPAVRVYSRGVTAAWTLYFALVALTSAVLHATGPTQRWSAFAALTSGPLVALLFALEFAVRRRLLPARDCASIGDTVRGFRALLRPRGEPSGAAARRHG